MHCTEALQTAAATAAAAAETTLNSFDLSSALGHCRPFVVQLFLILFAHFFHLCCAASAAAATVVVVFVVVLYSFS